MLQAANSGISSVTDRSGRRLEATDLNEVTVLEASFVPGPPDGTPYARYGEWVLAGMLVLVLAGHAVGRRVGLVPPEVSSSGYRPARRG